MAKFMITILLLATALFKLCGCEDAGASVDSLEAENEKLKSMMELLMKKTSIIAKENAAKRAEIEASIPISVKVFHFKKDYWGDSSEGLVPCDNIRCEWTNADHVKALSNRLKATNLTLDGYENETITMSLYNIHHLWEKRRDSKPALCDLHTKITMAESEESKVRYTMLFEQSSKHFDGISTVSPSADVQRVYVDAFLNSSTFLPMKPFASLVKGASYVASDCHKRDSANSKRDSVVHEIREKEFRVDGLGRCMSSPTGPEGISLSRSKDTRYSLTIKRQAINNYMFDLSFENSLERGYVTEKPFDALVSGIVPVYLGDAVHLKSLLPHPKAAIFIADHDNMTSLVEYLHYLTENETAYEEHREWRKTFSYDTHIKHKPLLQKSWYCRVCQWASKALYKPRKRTAVCRDGVVIMNATSGGIRLGQIGGEDKPTEKAPEHLWGKAVRSPVRKQLYFVTLPPNQGVLRAIPDMFTFIALKQKEIDIIKLTEEEYDKYAKGPPMHRVVPAEEAFHNKERLSQD